MKKLLFCIITLFIQITVLYSQYDSNIFDSVSKSMRFEKWEQINSISLVFDYKQKNKSDNTSFSDLKVLSKESLLIDKVYGIKSESTGDNHSMIEKINKKYISFSFILNNKVVDESEKTNLNDDNDFKKPGFNFIRNSYHLRITEVIDFFTHYKDSLVFIKTTTLNNNICKVYGTKSFENPDFTFLINEDYKIVGMSYNNGYDYFENYSNYDGLIFPETILSIIEPYICLRKLLDLKQNIKFPENIFY